MTPGYVNIDFIMDRFKQDNPFFEDKYIVESTMIEWIGSALLKLPNSVLINKITDCNSDADKCIVIENYRALLPCDLIHLKQVKLRGTNIVLKYSEDDFIFHKTPETTSIIEYKIQGDYIYTNIDNLVLELSYLGLPLDNNEKPLIPNNEYVIDYIVKLLSMNIAKKLWMMNLFDGDKYRFINNEYIFAKRQAESDLKLPSPEQMINITHNQNRITRNVYSRNYSYRENGYYSV